MFKQIRSIIGRLFSENMQMKLVMVISDFFLVSKKVQNGVTSSEVLLLKDFGARKSALAQLAGGNYAEASVYAASLLENKAA